MAYQVLARKYRPQRFEDVIGQRGVTQTLRNAIAQERLAQAFVFAGPRGVGKTTTARILARALSCDKGPTPDPCGTCDPCIEIAEGRDIDVLEIDAATHTQVENVREVIIAGLAMAPVRDRFKIFIIDEFHQLSTHSFNALLKSIEEPPPHVVFMMATTELQKIPDTILSRSQVFEFRTIGTQTIGRHLRQIAETEQVTIDDAAIALIARSAEGSMRDAQSAFDQVIAFAGKEITSDAVSTVLGLIGRDPVLDVVEVIANEEPSAVFALAGRFVEAGYDLRLVCRELTRAIRDLMVLSVDKTRAEDPEIAADAERDRLLALVTRFSREDLMRAFDILGRAEFEIRSAAQPRYHFEMALLKCIHVRKLVPLTELLEGAGDLQPSHKTRGAAPAAKPFRPVATTRPAPRASGDDRPRTERQGRAPKTTPPKAGTTGGKAEILAEIKRAKKFFYGTVVAQAQRIDLDDDCLMFSFSPTQKTLASQLTHSRAWLESIALAIVGRKVTVAASQTDAASAQSDDEGTGDATSPDALREQAMDDQVVKAMLEVFPAQIGKVEKIE